MRHYFLLSKVYPKLRLRKRDQNRSFDPLEKELIWNRDRGLCKNHDCNRRVSFREATIHHVIEHTAGGSTAIQNGVLICPECHANRNEMQRMTAHFQDYLRRIYTDTTQQVGGEVVLSTQNDTVDEQANRENDAKENGMPTPNGKLKIVIDWGALDVDREVQTILEGKASDSIVKLLVELFHTFGTPIKQQLLETPVIRFPLSRNPSADFINRTTGRAFGSLPIPGTDLYFCPHSDNAEKVRRLNQLFSSLTLPGGRNFPPDSVKVSIEGVPMEE